PFLSHRHRARAGPGVAARPRRRGLRRHRAGHRQGAVALADGATAGPRGRLRQGPIRGPDPPRRQDLPGLVLRRARAAGAAPRVAEETAEDPHVRARARTHTPARGGGTSMSKQVGSTFESFLAERGLAERAYEQAAKEVLAEDIARAMARARVTKSE